MVHSSSAQQEPNTARNDARRHIKGLKRRKKAMAYTREQWEQRVSEAGAGRYEFVRWAVDGESGWASKCVVRCAKDGYEWSAEVNSIVNNGRGCPKCAGNRMHTSSEYIDKINSTANGRFKFVCWPYGFSNSRSKATCRCSVDGFEWSACVYSLVNSGTRCPQCSGKRRWTAEEKIEQINKLEGIEFVSWVDGYKNQHSKANVKCSVDMFGWVASANSLANGYGCPQCAGNRRWTADERVEQINKLENIEFVSWVDGYKGAHSKANVKCEIDGFEWVPSVSNLVSNGRGCPKCAKYGFQIDKTGYLYALRSECGQYVKVGISNNPKRRHKDLEKRTPFKFHVIERISGDGAKIAALEKYFHGKYERAGFVGFDGCTEWLICTPELLEELRELEDVK